MKHHVKKYVKRIKEIQIFTVMRWVIFLEMFSYLSVQLSLPLFILHAYYSCAEVNISSTKSKQFCLIMFLVAVDLSTWHLYFPHLNHVLHVFFAYHFPSTCEVEPKQHFVRADSNFCLFVQENFDQLNMALKRADHSWTTLTLKVYTSISEICYTAGSSFHFPGVFEVFSNYFPCNFSLTQ